MKRRLVFGLLVSVCALATAGCGGGDTATGAGAADVVPGGVPVYVSISTDFDGAQITQARELLDRFPGSSGLLRTLEAELASESDLDFEQDIRPALGDTLDVVLLEVPDDGAGEPPFVVLLQPDDPAKLDALLAASDEGSRPVTVEVDGWTAIADDQATLDRFRMAGDAESLAESDAFTQAMDGIEEDALARMYLDLPALSQAAPQAAPFGNQLEELFPVAPLGAAVIAEEDGFRFEAATTTSQSSESFDPELPDSLPAGALLYAGFGDAATSIREALNEAGEQNPEIDQQLAQIELGLGVSLDEDILPLLQQETALAVYPGAEGSDLPGFLLAMRVDDPDAALATIDRLLERAGEFEPGVPAPTPTDVDGVPVRELTFGDGMTVLYGGSDGKLFATNDPALVTGLTGDGEKLSGDAVFSRALEAADAPDEVSGLLYANLDDGVDYGFGLAERMGDSVPGPVRDNAAPLHSLLLFATQEDDRVRGSGFLALDE